MSSVIMVCVHCNKPLTYEEIPDGAGKAYWLKIPCDCGSRLFMQLEVPEEVLSCERAE